VAPNWLVRASRREFFAEPRCGVNYNHPLPNNAPALTDIISGGTRSFTSAQGSIPMTLVDLKKALGDTRLQPHARNEYRWH
jgi:hypothetical protein